MDKNEQANRSQLRQFLADRLQQVQELLSSAKPGGEQPDIRKVELSVSLLGDIRQALEALDLSEVQELEESLSEYQATNEALRQSLEELQVAEEELRLQNDELVLVHRELENERQSYRDLFDFAPDGYLITDGEGMIEEVNRAAVLMLNKPKAELENKPFVLNIAPEDKHALRQTIADANQGTGRQKLECRMQARGPKPFDAELHVVPIQKEGSSLFLLWLIRDVTEPKNAERALRRATQELERRVAERTAELEQRALELERANRDLQDFATFASHDLQAPLRKLKGFSTLLKQSWGRGSGPEVLDYLERMEKAANGMQDLIDDLLSYASVSSEEQAGVSVDLNVTLHGVLSDLQYMIDDSQAHVRVEKLPVVQADPPRMTQLFKNLLENALKFHRKGIAPEVRVFTADLSSDACQDQSCVEVVVQDNGIGIDPQFQKRVFQPFQRLHGRSAFEGSGVGLAICRKVVEQHGGKIWVKSSPGEGTAFHIVLPKLDE